MRILLIEKNINLAESIIDQFEDCSHYAYNVYNTTEALERFSHNLHFWDVIIVDDVDGEDDLASFVKEVQEMVPNFPMILHTKNPYHTLSPVVKNLFNNFVPKSESHSPRQLLVAVESLKFHSPNIKTIKVEQSPYDVARINKLHADALQVFWAIGKENKKDLALKWVEEHYLFMFSQLFKGCTVTQTLSDCKFVDVQPNEK